MRGIFFIIFILLFGSFCYALPVDVQFDKDTYYSGESVQGKLFFNEELEDEIRIQDFRLELADERISIYPGLVKLDEYTYFYFDLPEVFGNYSFVLEDVIYLENEILVEEDLYYEFFIEEINQSLLTIDPGVFEIDVIEGNYFYLTINNPGDESVEVNITLEDDYLSSVDGFLLSAGDSEEVEFYVSSVLLNENFSNILISYNEFSYNVPVFFKNIDLIDPIEVVEEGDLYFVEESLNITFNIGESVEGFVRIFNGFDKVLENVVVEVSENLEDMLQMERYVIEEIGIEESFKDRMYANELKDTEKGEYTGWIKLTYGGEEYDIIPVYVNAFGEDEPVEENITFPNIDEEDTSEPKDNKWNILFGVIGVILVISVFIFIRYKKSEKKV
jgi:hypothetical protein